MIKRILWVRRENEKQQINLTANKPKYKLRRKISDWFWEDIPINLDVAIVQFIRKK